MPSLRVTVCPAPAQENFGDAGFLRLSPSRWQFAEGTELGEDLAIGDDRPVAIIVQQVTASPDGAPTQDAISAES